MATDSPRIAELRRRVESDPSSIAFAQLAEEYRRSGNYEQAVQWCRTGLARFPGYMSARVTLGRALIELGKLEEARRELQLVLESAPDNLAATRGIAAIDERLGKQPAKAAAPPAAKPPATKPPAAARPEKAAAQKPPLKSGATEKPPAPVPAPVATPAAAPAPSSPTSNFDAMLKSLRAEDLSTPPVIDALLKEEKAKLAAPDVVLPPLPADTSKDDSFADLERSLREFDQSAHTSGPSVDAMEQMVVDELERWLSAIDRDRAARDRNPQSA